MQDSVLRRRPALACAAWMFSGAAMPAPPPYNVAYAVRWRARMQVEESRPMRLFDARRRRALEAAHAQGCRAYGDLGLAFDVFAADAIALARRRLEGMDLEPTPERIAAALDRAAGGDLYLARCCEHDLPGAWDALHDDLQSRLAALARKRGAGPAQAEEQAADVLAHLATPARGAHARTIAGTFAGTGSLFGWVAVMLIRHQGKLARKRRHLALIEESDSLSAADVAPREAPRPLEQAMAVEDAAALREAFGRGWRSLTPREQLTIALKYRDDLKQRAIARVLGVGPPRVTRLLQQGLRKLGEAVRRAGVEAHGASDWDRLAGALRACMGAWPVAAEREQGRGEGA